MFPLTDHLTDEMVARGWEMYDLAERLGIPEAELGRRWASEDWEDLYEALGRAFGVSPQLFSNLHTRWLDSRANPTQGVQG